VRIAIVGSGISGLGCAHLLGPHHDVTVFEASTRLGGHTNTVLVDDPVAGRLGIDTGFIVHNDHNYPNLVRLFDELGVETQPSEMSFGVHDRSTGFAYRASGPNTLLASRRNALRADWWRMLVDIPRFWRSAKQVLAVGDRSLTLDEFLAEGGYSQAFIDLHLIPMGSSIWSADPTRFGEFPAVSLFGFLDNHGLLGLRNRPKWRTVVGGSQRYIDEIVARFSGTIRGNAPVTSVIRSDDGVEVTANGVTERFDRVVLACHTDQALDLLADASPDEKEMLGSIAYQPNLATLHTDETVLPPTRRAWSAWNFEIVEGADEATLTYDLTALQRLPGSRRYLVSLNLDDRIDPETVIARFNYAHPVFDAAAIEAQRRLPEIDGNGGVHFAGAWAGHGFHEDGFVSAIEACRRIGVSW